MNYPDSLGQQQEYYAALANGQVYAVSCYPQQLSENLSGVNLSKSKKENGKTSMLKEFKSYVAEHKDLIFSIILLFLADKIFLEGACQAKIAALVHRIMEGMEKKVANSPSLNTEAK